MLINDCLGEKDHTWDVIGSSEKSIHVVCKICLQDRIYFGENHFVDALRLILPMAKGYTAVHPVGSNNKYIEIAENTLNQMHRVESSAMKFTAEMLANEFGSGPLLLQKSSNGKFPLDYQHQRIDSVINHEVTFQTMADRLNEILLA